MHVLAVCVCVWLNEYKNLFFIPEYFSLKLLKRVSDHGHNKMLSLTNRFYWKLIWELRERERDYPWGRKSSVRLHSPIGLEILTSSCLDVHSNQSRPREITFRRRYYNIYDSYIFHSTFTEIKLFNRKTGSCKWLRMKNSNYFQLKHSSVGANVAFSI